MEIYHGVGFTARSINNNKKGISLYFSLKNAFIIQQYLAEMTEVELNKHFSSIDQGLKS